MLVQDKESLKTRISHASTIREYCRLYSSWLAKQQDNVLSEASIGDNDYRALQAKWELMCRTRAKNKQLDSSKTELAKFVGFIEGKLSCKVPNEFAAPLITATYCERMKTFVPSKIEETELLDFSKLNINDTGSIVFTNDVSMRDGSLKFVRNGKTIWNAKIWTTLTVSGGSQLPESIVAKATFNKNSILLFYFDTNGYHVFEYELKTGKRLGIFTTAVTPAMNSKRVRK